MRAREGSSVQRPPNSVQSWARASCLVPALASYGASVAHRRKENEDDSEEKRTGGRPLYSRPWSFCDGALGLGVCVLSLRCVSRDAPSYGVCTYRESYCAFVRRTHLYSVRISVCASSRRVREFALQAPYTVVSRCNLPHICVSQSELACTLYAHQ